MKLKTFLSGLDLDERKRFCELAGTKHTHLWQILGGHRSPSLRMLAAFAKASRQMFPRRRRRWLTLDEMHAELEDLRAQKSEGATS